MQLYTLNIAYVRTLPIPKDVCQEEILYNIFAQWQIF